MRVLITHEESQRVMEQFLLNGHDAYSCDLLPCSGQYKDRHFQMDCFEAIKKIKPNFLGMHPECTRLTVTANRWYKPEYSERFPNIHDQRREAIYHFNKCVEMFQDIELGYIENPIGIMSNIYRKPNQIIHPFQFGDPIRKSTCLWLFGLPKLMPTNIVSPEIITFKSGKTMSKVHYESILLPKEERRRMRSKTYIGIAKAMADQWGNIKTSPPQ